MRGWKRVARKVDQKAGRKRGGWDRFGNSLAFEPKKPRGKRGELLSERRMTEGKEGPGFVQLGIGDFICGSWAVIVSLNTLRYPM
jgi:hypothetical protein